MKARLAASLDVEACSRGVQATSVNQAAAATTQKTSQRSPRRLFVMRCLAPILVLLRASAAGGFGRASGPPGRCRRRFPEKAREAAQMHRTTVESERAPASARQCV